MLRYILRTKVLGTLREDLFCWLFLFMKRVEQSLTQNQETRLSDRKLFVVMERYGPFLFVLSQRYSTTWIYEWKIEYTGLGLKFEAP